ncbi:MAG: hypothetical protein OXF02_03395 [Simkaniaceae bacterium]|nr:hypothetical protein [Simkaniaceae bacterium]
MKMSILPRFFLLVLSVSGMVVRAETETTIFPIADTDIARYVESRRARRAIDMDNIVRRYIKRKYLHDEKRFNNFLWRCSAGTQRTTMVDESRGLYPERGLVTIGSGGERCVVVYASFDTKPGGDRTYAQCVEKIIASLENVGFNGHLYYRKGGYPEPEGWELEYADVPYAFKIWMFKEAYELGFSSCLWIDSVDMANRPVDPLFEIIEKQGAFFITYPSIRAGRQSEDFYLFFDRYVFPEVQQVLENFVGTPIRHCIWANLFGLKMGDERVRSFIDRYDMLVKRRIPFYSGAPEEIVFSALCSLPEFNPWVICLRTAVANVETEITKARRAKYYFSRLCLERPELDSVVRSLKGPVVFEQKLRSQGRRRRKKMDRYE